ncbi:uroporphyrinogen-III C-methyltransferase [Variovorax terrae]|uniref:Uroporphyrinogen-III C-methyltransferase n=1 Tax=Variovorax terrae TaxID=2923278 RepID=A0A9X1VY69_9BURK|nr:uroporphyrinogen-III C-methyltransferase [Variovorax terrae]MCJ0764339.1 uroporphyrinogen-III C-methyltransferase [Variovorax terrae]
MSSEPVTESVIEPAAQAQAAPASVSAGPPAGFVAVPRLLAYAVVVLAALALLVGGLLWQKLGHIQEELARRSADSGAQAVEARTLARQAQDLARDTAARQAVTDTRLSEVSLQRTQLEDLMQSLSRSRDENLVVDIESSLRLAQQQAQLTGSVEPLLAALKTADQRVARAAQPRLTPVQRALARDIDRIKAASVTDTPGLLVKLDELVRQVDELPLLNAVASARAVSSQRPASAPADAKPPPATLLAEWWRRALALVHEEARGLVRVSRIEQPEAVLLSPEQSFFLRENLKLKLLNARLGLLARQLESSRADLAAAAAALNKYFDPASRKTQAAASLLQQVQGQMKSVELPRVDDTLAALATAAAGR